MSRNRLKTEVSLNLSTGLIEIHSSHPTVGYTAAEAREISDELLLAAEAHDDVAGKEDGDQPTESDLAEIEVEVEIEDDGDEVDDGDDEY